ncbi:cell division protein ZapA [Candidatus Aerophobetes bacterium]|uniref:Cell division protein ZapA n=1 Tax=Aerophobetes bacterium TaxID=2030807 RepID=A0A497E456_UNCAE|nr:MAG: cell division protein ZapA [Candidatus Aerophobetes bacterium]
MGVRVRIFNKEYNLKADEEDEEYLRMVAAYVDDKIRKIATSTSGGVEQISVLACLNIADELYKLKERNRRAKEKIQKLIERIDKESK